MVFFTLLWLSYIRARPLPKRNNKAAMFVEAKHRGLIIICMLNISIRQTGYQGFGHPAAGLSAL